MREKFIMPGRKKLNKRQRCRNDRQKDESTAGLRANPEEDASDRVRDQLSALRRLIIAIERAGSESESERILSAISEPCVALDNFCAKAASSGKNEAENVTKPYAREVRGIIELLESKYFSEGLLAAAESLDQKKVRDISRLLDDSERQQRSQHSGLSEATDCHDFVQVTAADAQLGRQAFTLNKPLVALALCYLFVSNRFLSTEESSREFLCKHRAYLQIILQHRILSLKDNPRQPPDMILRLLNNYDFLDAGGLRTTIKLLLESEQLQQGCVQPFLQACFTCAMRLIHHKSGRFAQLAKVVLQIIEDNYRSCAFENEFFAAKFPHGAVFDIDKHLFLKFLFDAHSVGPLFSQNLLQLFFSDKTSPKFKNDVLFAVIEYLPSESSSSGCVTDRDLQLAVKTMSCFVAPIASKGEKIADEEVENLCRMLEIIAKKAAVLGDTSIAQESRADLSNNFQKLLEGKQQQVWFDAIFKLNILDKLPHVLSSSCMQKILQRNHARYVHQQELIGMLKDRLSDLRSPLKSSQADRRDLLTLKKKLGQSEANVRQLQRALQDAKKQLATAQRVGASAGNRRPDVMTYADAAAKSELLRKSQAAVRRLSAQLSEEKSAAQQAKDSAAKKGRQLDALTKKLGKLQGQLRTLQDGLEKKGKQCTAAESALRSKAAEHDRLLERVSGLEQEIKRLEDEARKKAEQSAGADTASASEMGGYAAQCQEDACYTERLQYQLAAAKEHIHTLQRGIMQARVLFRQSSLMGSALTACLEQSSKRYPLPWQRPPSRTFHQLNARAATFKPSRGVPVPAECTLGHAGGHPPRCGNGHGHT